MKNFKELFTDTYEYDDEFTEEPLKFNVYY